MVVAVASVSMTRHSVGHVIWATEYVPDSWQWAESPRRVIGQLIVDERFDCNKSHRDKNEPTVVNTSECIPSRAVRRRRHCAVVAADLRLPLRRVSLRPPSSGCVCFVSRDDDSYYYYC